MLSHWLKITVYQELIGLMKKGFNDFEFWKIDRTNQSDSWSFLTNEKTNLLVICCWQTLRVNALYDVYLCKIRVELMIALEEKARSGLMLNNFVLFEPCCFFADYSSNQNVLSSLFQQYKFYIKFFFFLLKVYIPLFPFLKPQEPLFDLRTLR